MQGVFPQQSSIFSSTENPANFFEKRVDIFTTMRYNSEAVSGNAAIAQPVERILGKDEVASSNLASSSKKEPTPFGVGSFLRCSQI